MLFRGDHVNADDLSCANSGAGKGSGGGRRARVELEVATGAEVLPGLRVYRVGKQVALRQLALSSPSFCHPSMTKCALT